MQKLGLEYLSMICCTLRVQSLYSETIWRIEQKNLFVTSGYGAYKDAEIRIANFPTTTIADMQNLIGELNKLDNA